MQPISRINMEHARAQPDPALDAEDRELAAVLARSRLETTISEVLVAEFAPVYPQYCEPDERVSDAELSRLLQAEFNREAGLEPNNPVIAPPRTVYSSPLLTIRGNKIVRDESAPIPRASAWNTNLNDGAGAGPSVALPGSNDTSFRGNAPGGFAPVFMPDVTRVRNRSSDVNHTRALGAHAVERSPPHGSNNVEPMQHSNRLVTALSVPFQRPAVTIIGPAPMTTSRDTLRPPPLPPPPSNAACSGGLLSPVSPSSPQLNRPDVVLDGLNVGCTLGGAGNDFFRARGIHLALEYYRARRVHAVAILPSNKVDEKSSACADDVQLLWKLFNEKRLFFTPSGDSDDIYILRFCMENDAFVISNDNFRRELHSQAKGKEMKKWLAVHRVGFSFINDQFIPRPNPNDLMNVTDRQGGRRRNGGRR